MAIAAILAITLIQRFECSCESRSISTRRPWLNRIGNALFVGTYHSEKKHPISRRLIGWYEPVVKWVLNHKRSLCPLRPLHDLHHSWLLDAGFEFMPTLHEGSLLYMPTALPGISVSEAQRVLTDRINLKSFRKWTLFLGKRVAPKLLRYRSAQYDRNDDRTETIVRMAKSKTLVQFSSIISSNSIYTYWTNRLTESSSSKR